MLARITVELPSLDFNSVILKISISTTNRRQASW